MPLNQNALAESQLESLISRRKSTGRISKADRKKMADVSRAINDCDHDTTLTMQAFIDYTFPGDRSSRSPRNLMSEWKKFEDETLPLISHLFPITAEDETLFKMFHRDWHELPSNPHRVGQLFIHKQVTRVIKISKIHRNSSNFYRFLGLVRYYQPQFMQRHFPLFTLRSFLTAQVETLSTFVDRLKLGNLVSEKARERYEDWYEKAFYSTELVRKAKTRPSANNPVCTSDIRIEYEMQRFDSVNPLGSSILTGEVAVPFYNIPTLFTDKIPEKVVDAKSDLVIPPTARD